jgi:hypothetical protein
MGSKGLPFIRTEKDGEVMQIQIYPIGVEAQFVQNRQQKISFHRIKSFFHINLYSHLTSSSFFGLDNM